MKKYKYVCTLTDDRVPSLILIVDTEKEAFQWVSENTRKHRGWFSKWQWAYFERVEYRA